MNSHDIIQFWFTETTDQQRFAKDEVYDRMLVRRFGQLHAQVAAGEKAHWRQSPLGRLAEIIVLDQFSRNMFRDSVKAFAYDGQALMLAQEALTQASESRLTLQQKAFLYMPFMHSESLHIHQKAKRLFGQPGLENNLRFELAHAQIIERFGRYPHRNAILGRSSSAAELAFLKQPGSSF